jgi:hypothetical protein
VGRIFFPYLGAEVQTLATTRSLVEEVAGAPTERVIVPGDRRFVVIVSHDCEFNVGKRNRLLVARIEPVPGHLKPEQLDDLRESNDVRARAAAGKTVAGVDSFVLAPLPGAFEIEQIAVFTTITPLPMKMAEGLRSAKRAEMNHDARVLFRDKLAWFVGRAEDDISDDEKADAPSL